MNAQINKLNLHNQKNYISIYNFSYYNINDVDKTYKYKIYHFYLDKDTDLVICQFEYELLTEPNNKHTLLYTLNFSLADIVEMIYFNTPQDQFLFSLTLDSCLNKHFYISKIN